MNLKKRRRNKSTGARVCVSIAPAAVTSASAVTTSITAAIAAAVIPGMAVPTEPAVITGFAAGIGASRTIIARCMVLSISALILVHEPAKQYGPGHHHQRQQLVLHRRYPLELCIAQLFRNAAGFGPYYDCAVH
jgi:hypothetical protein